MQTQEKIITSIETAGFGWEDMTYFVVWFEDGDKHTVSILEDRMAVSDATSRKRIDMLRQYKRPDSGPDACLSPVSFYRRRHLGQQLLE